LTIATGVVGYVLDNNNAATQALTAGQNVSDTFGTLQVTDGAATALSSAISFAITGSNDTPTVSAGAPSATLVEAGGVANAVAGTASASITLTKADADGTANFDTAYLTSNGWSTANSGVTYTKAGTHGTATLTIATGVVGYVLDNNNAATQALTGGQSVTDSFTVQVSDGSATSTANAAFAISGSNDLSTMNVSLLQAAGLGFQINGIDPADSAGVSVYGVGDVNADGLDDVIVGAYYGAGGSGQAYVVFGKSSSVPVNLSDVANGTGGTIGFAINHPTANGLMGISVAGVGDINGDGRADLLVSAPNLGRTYVVFGKSDGSAVDLTTVTNGAGGFAITDDTGANLAGMAISIAGDFNGDGLTDYIVGAPGAVSTGTTPTPGDVFLVHGKANFQDIVLSSIAGGNGGFKIAGSGTQQLGFSVSSAGDLNGDGCRLIAGSVSSGNGCFN
jgi:VCBS repeat-containing protein